MADLRLVSTTAIDRLAAKISEAAALSPNEGKVQADLAVTFFSALLGLPAPYYGKTSQTRQNSASSSRAA